MIANTNFLLHWGTYPYFWTQEAEIFMNILFL